MESEFEDEWKTLEISQQKLHATVTKLSTDVEEIVSKIDLQQVSINRCLNDIELCRVDLEQVLKCVGRRNIPIVTGDAVEAQVYGKT